MRIILLGDMKMAIPSYLNPWLLDPSKSEKLKNLWADERDRLLKEQKLHPQLGGNPDFVALLSNATNKATYMQDRIDDYNTKLDAGGASPTIKEASFDAFHKAALDADSKAKVWTASTLAAPTSAPLSAIPWYTGTQDNPLVKNLWADEIASMKPADANYTKNYENYQDKNKYIAPIVDKLNLAQVAYNDAIKAGGSSASAELEALNAAKKDFNWAIINADTASKTGAKLYIMRKKKLIKKPVTRKCSCKKPVKKSAKKSPKPVKRSAKKALKSAVKRTDNMLNKANNMFGVRSLRNISKNF